MGRYVGWFIPKRTKKVSMWVYGGKVELVIKRHSLTFNFLKKFKVLNVALSQGLFFHGILDNIKKLKNFHFLISFSLRFLVQFYRVYGMDLFF